MLRFIKRMATSVVDRIVDFQSYRFSEGREKRLLTSITANNSGGGGTTLIMSEFGITTGSHW